MMVKEFTHYNIFTYDLESYPGFETATLKIKKSELRKEKISKILKNPLK